MYWALDNRPPTLDEIMRQGAERIRAAVEAAIEKHSTPKLEIRCTEIYDDATINPRSALAAHQKAALAQMAAQQDMNVRFGITASGQQVGFGGYNAFTGYGSGSVSGMGQMFGGIL